ncbi:DUF4062 domain-containing protein [bacterium]|nr:DUF4062 domain-containing protein [candidate division CSSED10-310 bacterium]
MQTTVFISSRINELISERTVAYRACFEEGLTPVMFETEPIEDVKRTIDSMLDVSDHFLGLFFHTVGAPQFSLNGMTPIEYEICRFIHLKCPNRLSCETSEVDCLSRMRRIVSGHYAKDRTHKGPCKLQSKNDNDTLEPCVSNLEAIRKRGLIHIYCKYPYDEKSLSPEMLALLQGLRDCGFEHSDFSNQWGLARQLHDDMDTWWRNGSLDKSVPAVWLKYRGKDTPGMMAQLLRFALMLNLNVDFLSSYVDDENLVKIDARFSLWRRKNREEDSTGLKVNVENMIHFSMAVSAMRQGYLDCIAENHGRLEKWFPAETLHFTDSEAVFHRFTHLRLNLFENDGFTITTTAEDDGHRMAEIVDRHMYNPLPELDSAQHIRVKIVHLNVPGVMFRITNLLAGNCRDRFPYTMNNRIMLVNEYRENIQHRIGVPLGKTCAAIMEQRLSKKKTIVPWNIRGQYLQATEMILSCEHSMDPDFTFILHSALFSIIGVESVHVANVHPERL